jgi:hypothetical protein
MKKLKAFCFLLVFITTSTFGQNQYNVISDNWSATDGLGRKLPDYKETGHQKDKFVGMFYWTWHTDFVADPEVMNITEILNQYPEAATELNHPAWKGIIGGTFWWDEPLFGYYRTTDEWILRKHAEMLADAGIDVVFFDCTNGSYTWKSSYTALLKVWDQARKDGVKTPHIAFLMPFGATEGSLKAIDELFTDLYQPQLYKDLWFMWNNKPLIMAYPEMVSQPANSAGLKFTATSSFSAVNATCPSWADNLGSLTMRLYKWNTTYTQSVAGNVIETKTFVNFNDNAKLALTFATQPAGDYVWELSGGSQQVGVWKWTNGTNTAVSFYNGIVVNGSYESEISYGSTVTNFTALTNGTQHTPVVIDGLGVSAQRIDEMKNFFTFRPGQPDYVNGPSRNDQWSWNEVYPQHAYAPKPDGGFEQAAVGVAQNASDASGGHASGFNTPLSYGRSYTKAKGQNTTPEAYFQGLNFQEQWDRANTINPDLIFVTGWNEWIAGRWTDWDVKPFAFVDEYSAEKSRDIEPVKSWGDKGDVYYMQLIDNVRKFKGMVSQDTVSEPKSIDLATTDNWGSVKPEYFSYKGNTIHRNHPGQGPSLVYTNTSGRNDLISAKVARDEAYIYFYVETADTLTSKTDPKWMRLFIDIDRDKSTGWEGYDYIINRSSPEDSVLVEKSQNSWEWTKAGNAAYAINGKSLVLKIKKSTFGFQEEKGIDIEFKWSDNMQEDGNIMDFYVNGDVAPGARFNYVFKENWTADRYHFSQMPKGINSGLKSELFEGIFDSIPAFENLSPVQTDYPETIAIPNTTINNFGLLFTGYLDVPAKDAYQLSMNTDLESKLYIDDQLVVASAKMQGEQNGIIKLMPGKHALRLEYITKEPDTKQLDIFIESSQIVKSLISSSMLFKQNVAPSVTLAFNKVQNYYTSADSLEVSASDSDGLVSKMEIYDNGIFFSEGIITGIAVNNLQPGNHKIYAVVVDNDGKVSESNTLQFEVRLPFLIPGTIKAEEYSAAKNAVLINSTDSDGGKSIRVAYGWTEYPVNIPETGKYQLTFRVPASTSTKKITITSNNVELGTVDVGNTGTAQAWFNVSLDLNLTAGIQVLHFDFAGLITLHRMDILLATGLNPKNKMEVRVFPNPSSNSFIVQTQDALASLILYDMLGNAVIHSEPEESSFERKFGSDLHSGIYFLVVTYRNGARQRIKLIKN